MEWVWLKPIHLTTLFNRTQELTWVSVWMALRRIWCRERQTLGQWSMILSYVWDNHVELWSMERSRPRSSCSTASPALAYPCFYGIDIQTCKKLTLPITQQRKHAISLVQIAWSYLLIDGFWLILLNWYRCLNGGLCVALLWWKRSNALVWLRRTLCGKLWKNILFLLRAVQKKRNETNDK